MKPPKLTTLAGAQVSRFSFGTMQFGGKADKKDSQELYDASRAVGINFFDTANVYSDGRSEELLGEFVTKERENIAIASKCGSVGGATPQNIRAQFDESRARLKTDIIDVFYLHRWDDETPLEETFSTLADLREAGSIRYIGVSNFAAWQTMKAANAAEKLGIHIDILQPMYSLVKRQVEIEILPMAVSEGFNVASYSPLGGGLLTGKYTGGAGGRISENEMYKARYGENWMHKTAQSLSEFAAKIDTHPAALAVAWAARNPAITHPIISARSVAQFAPSIEGMRLELSDDLYAKISALSRLPAPATDR